jgi:hypothetical protein
MALDARAQTVIKRRSTVIACEPRIEVNARRGLGATREAELAEVLVEPEALSAKALPMRGLASMSMRPRSSSLLPPCLNARTRSALLARLSAKAADCEDASHRWSHGDARRPRA